MENPAVDTDASDVAAAVPTGVKLPYFHRTQTQEEKDLIGDITPKPIITGDKSSSGSKSIALSASWNTAETWEERDCSEWSKEKLQFIFSEKFEISAEEHKIVLSSLGEFNSRYLEAAKFVKFIS